MDDKTKVVVGVGVAVVGVIALLAFGRRSAPAASLTSIAVSGPSNVNAGGTVQLQATATYNDGSTADVTNQVSWSSDQPAFATVSGAGLVTGVTAGIAQISALLAGITGAITVTVIASGREIIDIDWS